MLPDPGCDPRINVIRMGAHILYTIRSSPVEISKIMHETSSYFNVSLDHAILALDWLFIISAVDLIDDKVKINGA